MEVTWYGHSAFLLDDGFKILVDPFMDDNPECPISSANIDPDVIAITHGHSDHLADAPSIGRRTGVPILAIHEIGRYLEKQGLVTEELNMGGYVEFDGRDIRMVYALHSSGIEMDNFEHEGGVAAGYIIDMEHTVYHSGDTMLFSDMRWMGDMWGPEIALLPIGGRFTMDVEQARKAVEWLDPELVIPMHYGTFEIQNSSADEFKKKVEKTTSTEVMILEPGETEEISL